MADLPQADALPPIIRARALRGKVARPVIPGRRAAANPAWACRNCGRRDQKFRRNAVRTKPQFTGSLDTVRERKTGMTAMMIDVESYRQNAADCLRQAEGETEPEDKNILLNVALAWVRLAQQVQDIGTEGKPDAAAQTETGEAEANAETREPDNLGKALTH
jgi:hypothetical protein